MAAHTAIIQVVAAVAAVIMRAKAKAVVAVIQIQKNKKLVKKPFERAAFCVSFAHESEKTAKCVSHR